MAQTRAGTTRENLVIQSSEFDHSYIPRGNIYEYNRNKTIQSVEHVYRVRDCVVHIHARHVDCECGVLRNRQELS